MVNKCVSYGCKTGYISSLEDKKVASFHFHLKNQQLLNYWVHFVNRSDWMPSPNSVLCEKHFNEKYIIRGIKCKLHWNLDPIPEIFSSKCLKRPSTLSSFIALRRPPKTRIYQEDELSSFSENDIYIIYVGADDKGTLYKGVVAFMIVSLKKSVPFIIKAIPELTISAKWLSDQISSLSPSGFKIRGIVTENR